MTQCREPSLPWGLPVAILVLLAALVVYSATRPSPQADGRTAAGVEVFRDDRGAFLKVWIPPEARGADLTVQVDGVDVVVWRGLKPGEETWGPFGNGSLRVIITQENRPLLHFYTRL